MARYVRVTSIEGSQGSCRAKLRWRFCRFMVTIAVIVVLATASLSLAQRSRSSRALESAPRRSEETTNPWPWLLAFLLLGLAWYPAFKSSKRELEP